LNYSFLRCFCSCRRSRDFTFAIWLNWVRTLPHSPAMGGAGGASKDFPDATRFMTQKISAKKFDSHLNKICTTNQSIHVQRMFVSLIPKVFLIEFRPGCQIGQAWIC
jgi:hypothetical protein